MRRYPTWLLIMVCVLVTKEGAAMAGDNKLNPETVRERLKDVNYSNGVSKEDAVIIAQNYILDKGISLKDIHFGEPQVKQSGEYKREVLTRAYLEKKFDGGGEFFDWLMQNGYFQENSGNQGHPKTMTKDERKVIRRMYPKNCDNIEFELDFSHDCWKVTFQTSAGLKLRGLFWYVVDVDKHSGKVIDSEMGPS